MNVSLFHKCSLVRLGRQLLAQTQTHSRVGWWQPICIQKMPHPIHALWKALPAHGRTLWSWMRWYKGRWKKICTENVTYLSCTHVDIVCMTQHPDSVSQRWPARDGCTPLLPEQSSLKNRHIHTQRFSTLEQWGSSVLHSTNYCLTHTSEQFLWPFSTFHTRHMN